MELWENPRFSFPFLKFGTKLIFNYKSLKSVLAVTHCAMFISGIILQKTSAGWTMEAVSIFA
jgi:hypothetical protein